MRKGIRKMGEMKEPIHYTFAFYNKAFGQKEEFIIHSFEYQQKGKEVLDEIKKQIENLYDEPKKVILGIEDYLNLMAYLSWKDGLPVIEFLKNVLGLEIILAGRKGIQVIYDFEDEFIRQVTNLLYDEEIE